MTRLLVSVRSAEEAKIALAGGADVIDVKEPRRGALGPADPEVWMAIKSAVDSQAVTSVALGELLLDPVEVLAGQVPGFAFAKIGLAGCGHLSCWPQRWQRAVLSLPKETLAVPVAYADCQPANSPPINHVLEFAAGINIKLLLMDTYDKSKGRLTEHFSRAALAEIVALAAERGVQLALAGSLQRDDIAKLLPLRPAYVGVRGAACRGGRDGTIDLARVKSLAAIVRGENENEISCCLTTPRATQILPSR